MGIMKGANLYALLALAYSAVREVNGLQTVFSHNRMKTKCFSADADCAELSPAEGEVILFRVGEESPVKLGLVIAEMHCTQWVQPLVVQEPLDADEVVLFEDADVDTAIQIQGTCVAVLDTVYGQLPVPQLGGGVGYGAPAVDCYTVNGADLRNYLDDDQYEVEVKVTESGIAPWTH